MKTNTDIKNLAAMKIKTSEKIISLIEPIAKALEQFNGKSITGNKKRITDAIENIADGLRVYIEYEQYCYELANDTMLNFMQPVANN